MIIAQLRQLTPSDLSLDPSLEPLLDRFRGNLPQITQLLGDFDGVIAALPQLLGVEKPSTYLMMPLDSSELRPSGGFIGNFGALSIDKGRLEPSFHMAADAYPYLACPCQGYRCSPGEWAHIVEPGDRKGNHGHGNWPTHTG